MTSTVKFSRLPTQGVVNGIDGAGFVALAVAVLIGAVSVIGEGLLGLLSTIALWAPLAALGLLRRHGQSLITHVLREVGGILRKMMGATTYRARPEKKKITPTSAMDLPGREGRIHLYETERGEVVVWDASKATATVCCVVATYGLGMPQSDAPSTLSEEDREGLIYDWSKVLGSFTQKEHITRIALLEQVRPGTIALERKYFEERSRNLIGGVSESYQEALELADESVVRHTSVISITFKLTGEVKALVKSERSEKAGMLKVAELEIATTTDALYNAAFTRTVWMNAREWAAWGRSLIDPVSQAGVDARIGGMWEGVDPQSAAPMLIDEHRTVVETDSAWHRTYWIQEWPRYETYPGFMSRLIQSRQQSGKPVRQTFMLVGEPVQIGAAMKKIDEQKRTWITNDGIRQKSGRPTSKSDEADWVALEQQEADLVAGQGELRFSAYLTVTATSPDTLEQEAASIRNACSATGLEPRSMPWQQAEALMNVAYPCGLGMQ
ncbi:MULTISPECIES: SCO6880 family protein [unclassified Leucobacter]|uniref:SCO6880 family protein n=1 Tax=unclassified Leucobacter TaxID=2621730 RepID=UPI003017DEA1